MMEFQLPWEEEEIKRVIMIFGCKVMGIEEVVPRETMVSESTREPG